MFTGLIESTGTIRSIVPRDRAVEISILPETQPFVVAPGGSVAVNGACLTLERCDGRVHTFTAVAQTIRATTLGSLRPGDRVNLERSLLLGARLDGHLVQGHIDGIATVHSLRRDGDSLVVHFQPPAALVPFIATRGSVAIDGISLTVVESQKDSFSVSFIPHTLAHTIMPEKKPGDTVNIECDVVARYIFQLLKSPPPDLASGDTTDRDQGLLSILERYSF